MSTFMKLITAATLAFALTACGKSSEEKAQDRAKDLVAEQNALVNELNSKRPNTSWTDAELSDYLGKLNRLEQVEAELKAADGNKGVYIFGGNNGSYISQKRSEVYSIQSQKRQAEQARTQAAEPEPETTIEPETAMVQVAPSDPVTFTSPLTAANAVDRYNRLLLEMRALHDQYENFDVAKHDTRAEIADLTDKNIKILDRMLANIEARLVIVNAQGRQFQDEWKLRRELRDSRVDIEALRKSTETLKVLYAI